MSHFLFGMLLKTQNSKLKTQNSKLKTQNSKLKTQNSKLETRNSKLETAPIPPPQPHHHFQPKQHPRLG